MARILVGTTGGLFTFDEGGPRTEVSFDGRSVDALGRAREESWAALDGNEIWRTNGDEWSHVADLRGLRATGVTAMRDETWVGTSQAHLYRVSGDGLERIDSFDTAPGRDAWYTPWGGPPDTRSIANWEEDVYVNVHVGGILHTGDVGLTWTPTIDLDADVHHVTTWEDLVLAACARGLAVGRERGAAWSYRNEGLDASYCRAVAVCGDVVLLSASRGPRGGDAAVYRAGVTDGSFVRCREGLPDGFDDNIDTYCLDALPEDGSFAAFGTSDGRVFASTDQGALWGEVATGIPPVRRVLVMP